MIIGLLYTVIYNIQKIFPLKLKSMYTVHILSQELLRRLV